MRILGIDYGDKKIGISVSDSLGIIAQGLEIINYDDVNIAINRIRLIVKEYEIYKIVIGMPKNMNGTIGFRGEKTAEFIELLKEFFSNEIITWDERLSTKTAQDILISANVSRKKRRKSEDKIAASIILQSYLDYLSNCTK